VEFGGAEPIDRIGPDFSRIAIKLIADLVDRLIPRDSFHFPFTSFTDSAAGAHSIRRRARPRPCSNASRG